ncbi:MAG: ATP-binding protein [Alphaproteobacteria bacterium]|nr:ATP-binding protein [Alphaproteobacteria bacterium]
MSIANFLSVILSFGALGLGIAMVLKRGFRQQEHKFFPIASLGVIAVTAAYGMASLFGWAPIWLIHFDGNTTEVTGVVTGFFAVMAALLLERSVSEERASREIAQEREIQEELRLAKETAERARLRAQYSDRAKSEFLANMSHELRTPLNAIIGFSELMSSEVLGPLDNPHYREYSRNIKDSGDLLLKIINDILDLSKIEAGAFELDERELDLRRTIDGVVSIVGIRAKEKNLDLTVIPPSDRLRLRADERALKQMLLNLLSNAIKFTECGGAVRISTHHNHDGSLQISVSDSGIGIAACDIQTVFAEFGQVESALSRSQQGTGLGLPLTKRLIQLHGGTIGLESKPQVGTTMSLKFPPESVIIREPMEAAAPKIELAS